MLSKEKYVEKIVRDILNGEMKLEDFVSEHFELVKEYKDVRKELECYGNKEDLIQCIFALIKMYFRDFEESEE